MDLVKKMKKCFNCFQDGHMTRKCTSRNTCFQSGCNERHHTTLHDYFLERGRLAKAKAEKKAMKVIKRPKKATNLTD